MIKCGALVYVYQTIHRQTMHKPSIRLLNIVAFHFALVHLPASKFEQCSVAFDCSIVVIMMIVINKNTIIVTTIIVNIIRTT